MLSVDFSSRHICDLLMTNIFLSKLEMIPDKNQFFNDFLLSFKVFCDWAYAFFYSLNSFFFLLGYEFSKDIRYRLLCNILLISS